MIGGPLAAQELIPLITAVFLDKDEIKVVRNLSGGDAQAFIDKIDKVLYANSSCENGFTDLDSKP